MGRQNDKSRPAPPLAPLLKGREKNGRRRAERGADLRAQKGARRAGDNAPATLPPQSWKAWLAPAAIALTLYSYPLGTTPGAHNPNELSRLLLTTSLVHDRAIQVDAAMPVYGVSQDLSVREGRHYTDKAPGLSFLAAPLAWALRPILPAHEKDATFAAYWPLRHVLTFLLCVLPGALLPFWMLRKYPGRSPAARPWIALLIALTSPLLAYASSFFGHVPGSVMAVAAYVLLLKPGDLDARPTARDAWIGGLLAGLAAFTEYFTAIIGAAIGVALLTRRAGVRVIGPYICAGLIGVAPLFLYNKAAFGSPFATGYGFKTDAAHQSFHARGFFGVEFPTGERLWGVLFSARRGVFYYCPLLLLIPFGCAGMARRCRRDLLPLLLASFGYIFVASGFYDWRGGWCAAARHLVPLIPLGWYPLTDALESMLERAAAGALAALLAGVSLCQTLLTVAVSPFFPERLPAPLMQLAGAALREGAATPNLLSDLTGLSARLALAFFILSACAAQVAALWRSAQGGPLGRWMPAIVPTSLALAVGMQAAAMPAETGEVVVIRAMVLQRIGCREIAATLRQRVTYRPSSGAPAAPPQPLAPVSP